MTQEEAARHWRREAEGSLKMARLGFREGEYALALFHCHLAVEKSVKSLIMSVTGEAAPLSHDLLYLAKFLGRPLSEADTLLLNELNDFAVKARYSDPVWAETYATESRTAGIVDRTDHFLTSLFHGH